jgi:hypothetical protein
MPRSRHSQSRHLAYSGAPPYDAESASLNSYGFEPSVGLGDLSLSSPTALAPTTFESYQHHIAYAPNNSDFDQQYLQNYQTTNSLGSVQGA